MVPLLARGLRRVRVLILASLALVAGTATVRAAGDCARCTPTALCATHQQEETAALTELGARLKSKDPFDRKNALTKLAELDHRHPLCPTLETAKLVATALDDADVAVRTQAVTTLAGGMHPDVAVRGLVDALTEARKELAKIPFGRGDWGGGNNGDPPDPKAAERRTARTAWSTLLTECVTGLRKLPDDRSVAALAELLPTLTRWQAELLAADADALLALGARSGVAAIIARLKAAPVGDTGKQRFGPDTTGATLRDLLAKAAAAKGTDAVPEWSDTEPVDWERWFAKNQKHFAAKLGKYGLEELRKAAR